MPRLTDLHPAWIDHGDRKGLGVAFDCMVGSHPIIDASGRHDQACTIRNWILFSNPLDGGPPWPGHSRILIVAARGKAEDPASPEFQGTEIAGCGECRWKRTGETFETLSMSPSVNAGACGHFTLTNGVFG